MVRIYTNDEPILRKIAVAISVGEIRSSKIQGVIANMKQALVAQDDGVAICAPQIGQGLRIFVISGRILSDLAADEAGKEVPEIPDRVFINPEIVKISKKTEWLDEPQKPGLGPMTSKASVLSSAVQAFWPRYSSMK